MDAFYMPWLLLAQQNPDSDNDALEGTQQAFSGNDILPDVNVTPKYKLTFFPAKGMAEMIRIILAYSGESFIDNRIGFNEWNSKKHEIPFQQMPFIEFDGKILCQSTAIARYLAKKFGIAGRDDFEQAQVDAVIDLLTEFSTSIRPYINSLIKAFTTLPPHLDNLAPLDGLNNHLIPAIEKYMPILEQLANANYPNKWLFSSGLTFADIAVACFYESMESLIPNKLDKFKLTRRIKDNVFSLPQIQIYLKERPNTIL